MDAKKLAMLAHHLLGGPMRDALARMVMQVRSTKLRHRKWLLRSLSIQLNEQGKKAQAAAAYIQYHYLRGVCAIETRLNKADTTLPDALPYFYAYEEIGQMNAFQQMRHLREHGFNAVDGRMQSVSHTADSLDSMATSPRGPRDDELVEESWNSHVEESPRRRASMRGQSNAQERQTPLVVTMPAPTPDDGSVKRVAAASSRTGSGEEEPGLSCAVNPTSSTDTPLASQEDMRDEMRKLTALTLQLARVAEKQQRQVEKLLGSPASAVSSGGLITSRAMATLGAGSVDERVLSRDSATSSCVRRTGSLPRRLRSLISPRERSMSPRGR
jgi:hypothetical protein